MNERGNSSVAIVAIVVLVLVGLFVFMTYFGGGGGPDKVTAVMPEEINIDVKPGQ